MWNTVKRNRILNQRGEINDAFFKSGCKIPHTDSNDNRFADDSGGDWHGKYWDQLGRAE